MQVGNRQNMYCTYKVTLRRVQQPLQWRTSKYS